MLLSKEIEDLCDDVFEGSNDERQIFTEVFFSNDIFQSSRSCLVTGVINFECESSKNATTSLCCSNEKSVAMHPSSSRITHPEEDCNVIWHSKETAPGCMPESFIYDKQHDEDVNIKRMKLSLHELPHSRSDLEKVMSSSGPSKELVSNLSCALTDCDGEPIAFHLVESSKHGVTSSCLLLKHHMLQNRRAANDVDVRNSKITTADRNVAKEVSTSKVVASPVSQESSANMIINMSPSITVVEKFGSPLHPEETKGFLSSRMDMSELSSKAEKRDPRPLLHYHIVQLLMKAGWSIEKRQRPSRRYTESVYRTPEGRPIRDFPKAWRLCGQLLSADKCNSMHGDSKEWADISEFWSDLSSALTNVEKEMNQSEPATMLAYHWWLLDPFVLVIYINRKIGALKRGEVVKRTWSFVSSKYKMACSSIDLASEDTSSAQSNQKHEGQDQHLLGSCLQESLNDQSCVSHDLVHSHDLAAIQPSEFSEEESRKIPMASAFNSDNRCSPKKVVIEKKMRRKSKKVSEIKLNMLYHNDMLGTTVPGQLPSLNDDARGTQLGLQDVDDYLVDNAEKKGSRRKLSSVRCQIEDDDLLVSAIFKNKDISLKRNQGSSRAKSCKSRAKRKLKSRKGHCRLLPRNLGNGGNHNKDGKLYYLGSRTVLSWLMENGVISFNDVIQYRSPKDNAVIKDGRITKDGIICKCCGKLLSLSEFKFHAGFRLNRPCLSLFMESGEPFMLCLLQAWSAEYKARKSRNQMVQVDDDDRNDDSCGLCGEGGELICCDNCPSTYHLACLSTQDLPDGNWYCTNCTCRICGTLVIDKEASGANDALQCSQCEHKYHEKCLREKGTPKGEVSDTWFCGQGCQEVYFGIQSQVGFANHVADGFSWMLLRCIHNDQKVHSAQWLALKAVCNTKLAVALTIMEECFLSMVDPRTGIHMIPQVLYNWGSDFARLNFQGFYTLVLEKQDVLISVASIRVHGTSVAEMPLIATCSRYRRQGMCRLLVSAIEEMLKSVKVEKLVIAAIPDLVETWTKGFGFMPVDDIEKQKLNKINLMVFPGMVLLEKPLYKKEKTEGLCGLSTLATDDSVRVGICSKGMAMVESSLPDAGDISTDNDGDKSESQHVDGKNHSYCRAGSETSIDDDTQIVEGAKESRELRTCGGKENVIQFVKVSGVRRKSFEGNNTQELGISNKMQVPSESVQQSSENCCANTDGTESGVTIIEDMNIKIGEVQENALQGLFSKSPCRTFLGRNFDVDSNIECSMVYDETAFLGTALAGSLQAECKVERK